MNKETFEKETEMCRKLNKKNDGKCNWGECDKCGVIPFMYKIYKNTILEKNEEIKKVKDEIFK